MLFRSYTDLKQTTVVYGSRTYVDDREFLENGTELFVKRILGKLDLAHVKVADPADLEVLVDDLRTTTRELAYVSLAEPAWKVDAR